ncbi:hypothetical protein DFH27DRAFT_526824 [Peziza echinospora]|nr:hypothetical protein DFH27DRAFT_526824 [Peziza echinospora]
MWNPFRLASSLLPYLLLGIFVFPFAAHGFNRSEHDIPPPLPEHRWVGKSVLNYTVLHEHFVEVLVCTTIPVGALGFYFWLVLIVVDLISILKIAFARDKADDMSKQLAIGRHRQTTTRRRRREQGRHGLSQPNGTSQPVSEEPEEPPIKKLSKWETFLYFLKGIAGHAFSIGLGVFTIIQSIATLRDCENARGFDVIKGIIVTILVASFFSLLGNTMSLYAFLQTGWAGGGGAFKVAIFFLAVSVLIKYFAGGAYFLAVTVSEGILKKLWLHPDKTAVGAEVVTMLPAYDIDHVEQWIKTLLIRQLQGAVSQMGYRSEVVTDFGSQGNNHAYMCEIARARRAASTINQKRAVNVAQCSAPPDYEYNSVSVGWPWTGQSITLATFDEI